MRFLHPAALIRQDALFNPNHPLKISPPNPYPPSPLLVYSCNDSNPEVTAMSTRLFPLSPLAITTLLLTLSGCATSSTAVSSPTPSGTYTNWLIEGNSTLISPPVGQYMSGALQINGTQVTGTFSSHFACTPPTGTYTGTLNSAGDLTLQTIGVNTSLQTSSNPYTPSTGTFTAGGYLCLVISSGSAVGVEIAPLNGTLAGAVTATGVAPVPTGNVSLNVTQSTTPNANGQFPLTGAITFTSGTCSVIESLSGTISGEGVALTTASGASTSVQVTATTIPTATQVAASSIVFTPSPCSTLIPSATYTGTLQ